MSAKPKSPDNDNDTGPYIEPNQDPALEKKVDELLSIEEPETAPDPNDVPETSKKSIVVTHADDDYNDDDYTPEALPVAPSSEPPATSSVTDIGSAPLLPSDKLPNLEKKKIVPIVIAEEASTEPEQEAQPEIEPEPELEAFEPPDPQEEPRIIEPVKAPEPATPEPEVLPKPVALPVAQANDDLGLEDPNTSRAVDEIIAADADELLVARDHNITSQQAPTIKPKDAKPKKRIPKFVILLVLFLLLAGVGAVGAFPGSRYYALNTAGVRSAASVTVLDETTGQPLKNAEFTIAGTTAKTDSEGNARVEQLKQGDTTMTIKKPAFAEISQPVTVGWGSNPLGEFKIKAVGSQYKFVITDLLSKKPIAKVEASSGQANARSNEKGEIVLTLSQAETDKIVVQISAEGYRTENIDVTSDKKDSRALPLTPARKHVFISKRAGTFDVYKIDVDGKNEEKVLAGTGKERSESIALSTHPTRNIMALVSSREAGVPGKPIPAKLTIINLDDNTTSVATTSERVQLVDWIGNKLIYVKIAEGQTEDSTTRHRLVSYDLGTKSERELASSNYFNDVVAASGSIYYSPAAYQVNGTVGLYKINAEGNYKKTIFDKEVWNMFRTSYDKLSVSLGQEWFDLAISNDEMNKAGGPPPMLKSRVYFNNPDNSASLWVDERDGKGVLLSYDLAKKEDTVLLSQSGLKNPVHWLDSKNVIYRVNNSQETADYIFSTQGGQSLKIRDVTDTAGIDRWYFY